MDMPVVEVAGEDHGVFAHDVPPPHGEDADLFLLPSKNESFGLAALEAHEISMAVEQAVAADLAARVSGPARSTAEIGAEVLEVLSTHVAEAMSEVWLGKIRPDECYSPLWPYRWLFCSSGVVARSA